MSVTALPAAPTRSQAPAAFITTADAFLAALPTFATELNAVAQAGDFNASLWVSGTTYAIGDRRYSPIDYATYRRITAGAGTTDPSADTTNWAPIVVPLVTTAPRVLENLGLTVTMAANAVTIALKGANGSDPAAANKVGIGFRHATLATGSASKVQVSAATSTVISSGSTGGSVSAEASRVWIAAINNAGTVELAWTIRRSGTSVSPIDEGAVISTTAEGGAGAADTVATWYSTTARAGVPFAILGYFDSTQATAGTWATSPTSVVVNPDVRPGQIVQLQRNVDSAVATGATTTPNDDTIPQITEGNQFMTQVITPTAAANLLRWRCVINTSFSVSGANKVTALHQDAVANALAAVWSGGGLGGASQYDVPGILEHVMLAGTIVATTGRIRVGSASAGTFTFNGQASARIGGGVMSSTFSVEEIAA